MKVLMMQVRPAVLILAFMIVVTGVIYPLAITGIAAVAFGGQAGGSLITRNDEVVGSRLLGQGFVDQSTGLTMPGYFRGRPSAADYNASPSRASNMGPTNENLRERIAADEAIVRQENHLGNDVLIPIDLVTTSGSGLDPHISPASAELQVARVARERGMSEDAVLALVDQHTDRAFLGFFGEDRVNVLELNLALDAAAHS